MANLIPDIGLIFARPVALWVLAALPLIGVLGLFGGRRGLPRLAVALRLLIVLLLGLTLADPLLTRGGRATSTVFLIDRSASVTDQTDAEAVSWIMSALGEAGAGDRAAIISFGGSPVLAQSVEQAGDIGRGWVGIPLPEGAEEYTNLGSALALGRALPLGGAGRMVLLSDGAENTGSVLDQAAQAAADGMPIDVVPLPGVGDDDLRVAGVTAPSSTWQGEPFNVLVSVATANGGTGTVDLLVNGEVLQTFPATFPAGMSSYQFNVTDLSPGFHALEARVTPGTAEDRYPENNYYPIALVVRDHPRVLLVAPEGVDTGRLDTAFTERGVEITHTRPADVPSQISELGHYDAIILNNVPAGSLSLDQQANIRQVTQSLGRGLIVIGGTAAYGPGGYAGTLLEDALPVNVKVTDGREREKVALLLIIDQSGSMSYNPLGGPSKMEMAKDALKLAATSLNDGDVVGVLAFDDQQQWVVEMMEINSQSDRDVIVSRVEELQPRGGTEIYPAVAVGFDAIVNVDADVRHVVLLTDGKSRSGNRESYQRLLADVINPTTTLSTIAIGDDSDIELLMFLAEQGNGRYHYTDNADDIPRVTLQEAQSAGSQSVLRGAFSAIQLTPSPILMGLEPETFPVVNGYDYAEAKPAARVVLTSDRADPLLAKWQFGLGRVIAWTGDDGADFNTAWATWSEYGMFWNNMLSWTLPDPENRPLQVSVVRDGPEAVLMVDTLGDGQTRGGPTLGTTTATVTGPTGEVMDLSLYQSGPGQYQVRVAAPEPGAYHVALRQERGSDVIEELAGFAMPPSPELQPAPGSDQMLAAIAARTGGRVLSLDNASGVFTDEGLSGTALRVYRSIWYLPLTLALLLLLVEIGLRTGMIGQAVNRRR